MLLYSTANATSTVTPNLTACTLLDRVEAPVSAQPALSIDEQLECEQAVLEREQFRPALEQHDGISDTPLVMVDILSACYYGTKEDGIYRFTRPVCFLPNGFFHRNLSNDFPPSKPGSAGKGYSHCRHARRLRGAVVAITPLNRALRTSLPRLHGSGYSLRYISDSSKQCSDVDPACSQNAQAVRRVPSNGQLFVGSRLHSVGLDMI